MSVYTEDKDGNLILICPDKTIESVAAEARQAAIDAGEIPSDCIVVLNEQAIKGAMSTEQAIKTATIEASPVIDIGASESTTKVS